MKSEPRFAFIAGSPALCFVDTFGNRSGPGRERLVDSSALGDWLAAAGLGVERAETATESQLSAARSLREAIYRASLRAIAGKPPEAEDVALINRAALQPPLRPQWQGEEVVQVANAPIEAALSVLAADALQLFATTLRYRIRRCPGCAMIFVDRSRPGRRRWCSSAQGCGNRAKVRTLRARRAEAR